jgi:hypothetical protein
MIIELTLEKDGVPVMLHLTGNFAVVPTEKGSKIYDGEGGWRVRESYDEVTERIILLMR